MKNLLALAFSASNFGPKKFQTILNHFESLESAWIGTRAEYLEIGINDKGFEAFNTFRKNFDVDKYVDKLKKEKVEFISFLDRNYPINLKKLENPPIGIFIKGNKELLHEKLLIGVVGTRKMTSYGRNVTENIVSNLAINGSVIVSGLALGVDGAAHRSAVEHSGKTIAVLACGVDCCRPAENFGLYQEILKNNGLILSEYPLSLPPQKGTFLARNRIIAALSDGILVTEAAFDSGSLVTADWGFKLNKKVFAVPGQITSRMSDGSLKLLKRGATLVTSAQDILGEFNYIKKAGVDYTKKFKALSLEEKNIVSLLENEELSLDEISRKLKVPVSKLFIAISKLEIDGIVKNEKGTFMLTMRE